MPQPPSNTRPKPPPTNPPAASASAPAPAPSPPTVDAAKAAAAKLHELTKKQLELAKQKEAMYVAFVGQLKKKIETLGGNAEGLAQAKADLLEKEGKLAEARKEVAEFSEAVARAAGEGKGVQVVTTAPAAAATGGRGGPILRGGRGAGRFGGRGRGPMRIDNRTTCLKVVNRPEGVAPASLQSYFQNFGLIESVELLEEGEGAPVPAVVKFRDRRGAENAKANAKYMGSNLLTLEWYDKPRAASLPASASSASVASAGSGGGGGGGGGDDTTGMEQEEVDALDALLFQGKEGGDGAAAPVPAEEAMAVEGNGDA